MNGLGSSRSLSTPRYIREIAHDACMARVMMPVDSQQGEALDSQVVWANIVEELGVGAGAGAVGAILNGACWRQCWLANERGFAAQRPTGPY